MRAGVSCVRSMSICPTAQSSPPHEKRVQIFHRLQPSFAGGKDHRRGRCRGCSRPERTRWDVSSAPVGAEEQSFRQCPSRMPAQQIPAEHRRRAAAAGAARRACPAPPGRRAAGRSPCSSATGRCRPRARRGRATMSRPSAPRSPGDDQVIVPGGGAGLARRGPASVS